MRDLALNEGEPPPLLVGKGVKETKTSVWCLITTWRAAAWERLNWQPKCKRQSWHPREAEGRA